MGSMSGGGIWGHLTRGRAPLSAAATTTATTATTRQAAEGTPEDDPPAEDDSAAEFHFCCICGSLLDGDLEDEVDGEGPGRDICGDCNRTRNFEIELGF
jgi:hypothetical protein